MFRFFATVVVAAAIIVSHPCGAWQQRVLRTYKPYGAEVLVDYVPYHVFDELSLARATKEGLWSGTAAAQSPVPGSSAGASSNLLVWQERVTDSARRYLVHRLGSSALATRTGASLSSLPPQTSTACDRCAVVDFVDKGLLVSTLLHVSEGSDALTADQLELIRACSIWVPRAYTLARIPQASATIADALYYFTVYAHPSTKVYETDHVTVYQVDSEILRLSRWSTPTTCVLIDKRNFSTTPTPLNGTVGGGGGDLYTRIDALSPIWQSVAPAGYYHNRNGHLYLVGQGTHAGVYKVLTGQLPRGLGYITHAEMNNAFVSPFWISAARPLPERTVTRVDVELRGGAGASAAQLHWQQQLGVVFDHFDSTGSWQSTATQTLTTPTSGTWGWTLNRAAGESGGGGDRSSLAGALNRTVVLGRDMLETYARGVVVSVHNASRAVLHVLWHPSTDNTALAVSMGQYLRASATDTPAQALSFPLTYTEVALLIWILLLAITRKFPLVASQVTTTTVVAVAAAETNGSDQRICHPAIFNRWLRFLTLIEQQDASHFTIAEKRAPTPLRQRSAAAAAPAAWFDQFFSDPSSSLVDVQIYVLTWSFLIWRLAESATGAGSGALVAVFYTFGGLAFAGAVPAIVLFLQRAYRTQLVEDRKRLKSERYGCCGIFAGWLAYASLPGALLGWLLSLQRFKSLRATYARFRTVPVTDSLPRQLFLDTASDLSVFLAIALLCSWNVARSVNLVTVNLAAHLLIYQLFYRWLVIVLVWARSATLKRGRGCFRLWRWSHWSEPASLLLVWVWHTAALVACSYATLQFLFFPHVLVIFGALYSTATIVGLVWTSWAALAALTMLRFMKQITDVAAIPAHVARMTDADNCKQS